VLKKNKRGKLKRLLCKLKKQKIWLNTERKSWIDQELTGKRIMNRKRIINWNLKRNSIQLRISLNYTKTNNQKKSEREIRKWRVKKRRSSNPVKVDLKKTRSMIKKNLNKNQNNSKAIIKTVKIEINQLITKVRLNLKGIRKH